jgi:hypothetical protein
MASAVVSPPVHGGLLDAHDPQQLEGRLVRTSQCSAADRQNSERGDDD